MPSTPVIDQVECSSRNCTIKVEQPAWTPHLQVQYQDKRQRDWTTYPDSVRSFNSSNPRLSESFSGGILSEAQKLQKAISGLWICLAAELLLLWASADSELEAEMSLSVDVWRSEFEMTHLSQE